MESSRLPPHARRQDSFGQLHQAGWRHDDAGTGDQLGFHSSGEGNDRFGREDHAGIFAAMLDGTVGCEQVSKVDDIRNRRCRSAVSIAVAIVAHWRASAPQLKVNTAARKVIRVRQNSAPDMVNGCTRNHSCAHVSASTPTISAKPIAHFTTSKKITARRDVRDTGIVASVRSAFCGSGKPLPAIATVCA